MSRIALMMGLQYATLGLWAVTVNTYIAQNTGDQGAGIFGSGFIGLAATSGALGALLAPVVMGIVADRYFSTEKLLALLHLCCGACLWGMVTSQSQWVFFGAMLLYFQAYVPTTTLTNSLALRHLPDERRQFPVVRAAGTAGWVLAGIFIGLLWPGITGESIEATATPLKIAAAAELVMAIYCLTLPSTPAIGRAAVGWRTLTGGASLWNNRSFLLFLAISAMAAAPTQFYNAYANPFLNATGFEHAAAKLTAGQVVEVFCMLILPLLMVRVGLRRLFLIGAFAWAARFLLFSCSSGSAAWLAYPAILMHGACYVFVYMTGQLYADRVADPESRGAAQGLHALATSGFGHLIGALAARWAQATYLTPAGVTPAPYEWSTFWLFPAAASLAAAILFALFFADDPTSGLSRQEEAAASL